MRVVDINAPSDVFRTKDGWIIAYAIGNPMFARWAKLMDEDHWLHDPRFQNDQARGDHGAVISERMAEWTAERNCRVPASFALTASSAGFQGIATEP